MFISKQVSELNKELDTLTSEEIISQYDYSKIEKLHKKTERLRNSKRHQESYLYDLDDLIKESDSIIK